PMVSGYHFLPVAPASWRKTTPAAAVTSVNCRAAGGSAGGATTVTWRAGLGDSCGFWESLHALVSRARHTTLLTHPLRAMLRRFCRGFPLFPPASPPPSPSPIAGGGKKRLSRHVVEMTGRIMPLLYLL